MVLSRNAQTSAWVAGGLEIAFREASLHVLRELQHTRVVRLNLIKDLKKVL
jgi:hypothetical protein